MQGSEISNIIVARQCRRLVDSSCDESRKMRFVTWEEFEKVFQDKFYPRLFCDARRNEFIGLIQGEMTVTEYEKMFTELAK